ncbi:hypothetical protein SYJ56_15035 [Algoriphagus sp. D3-2-R+10]|nr:hypothetical protein [Algoriphagus sp. D3-2-R+10]
MLNFYVLLAWPKRTLPTGQAGKKPSRSKAFAHILITIGTAAWPATATAQRALKISKCADTVDAGIYSSLCVMLESCLPVDRLDFIGLKIRRFIVS